MQLAISDLVLTNKTDLATREYIDGIAAVALAQKPARSMRPPLANLTLTGWRSWNGPRRTAARLRAISRISICKS